jgi:uncharacterized protein
VARVLVSVVVAVLIAACVEQPDPCDAGGHVVRFGERPGRAELRVEIADSDAERRRGLMDRISLGADRGMVFLFEGPTDDGFWMKDTLIPLSIAFWDEEERIVAMLDMHPCRASPCQVYSPGVTYVGAVEANLGYFDEHGVEVGDGVELIEVACA